MNEQGADQGNKKPTQQEQELLQASQLTKIIIKFFLIASAPIASVSLIGYVIALCLTILIIAIIEIHRIMKNKTSMKGGSNVV